MADLICRKTMMRCNTPGTCSPHGGCRVEPSILTGYVLIPRTLLEALLDGDNNVSLVAARELRALLKDSPE